MDEYGLGIPFIGDEPMSGGGSYGGSIGNWSGFFQDVSKMALGTVLDAKYKAPLEIEKMRLQAYGPYGQPYLEGMPNMNQPGTIPGSWLLLGGLLLAGVMLAKD